MSDNQIHSEIGASSMHRWAACPGSVRLSRGIPKTSSRYAEEGTLAHTIASNILVGLGTFFNLKEKEEDLPADMLPAVNVYVEVVAKEHLAAGENAKRLIEHRFNLSKIFPGLYGTSDAIIYSPAKKLLQVFDYKHGAGIAVDVVSNEQLMYYALGALLEIDQPVATVEVIIVQPRCAHEDGQIRRWSFPAIDLIDFAADLKEFAARTQEPNAPLVPGKDQCTFCPAAGVCPALHDQTMAVAKLEFTPTLSYDPAKLSKALDSMEVVEAWIKNTREFAYNEAIQGRVPPGYKLVDKRATRRWKSEAEAIEAAKAQGLKVTEEKTVVITAPAFEKQIGKKVFTEKFAHLVTAESSGTTLVHESDKRPTANDPKKEFNVIEATNAQSLFD